MIMIRIDLYNMIRFETFRYIWAGRRRRLGAARGEGTRVEGGDMGWRRGAPPERNGSRQGCPRGTTGAAGGGVAGRCGYTDVPKVFPMRWLVAALL